MDYLLGLLVLLVAKVGFAAVYFCKTSERVGYYDRPCRQIAVINDNNEQIIMEKMIVLDPRQFNVIHKVTPLPKKQKVKAKKRAASKKRGKTTRAKKVRKPRKKA